MPSKRRIFRCATVSVLIMAGLPQSALSADLSTLFTTPQERQIINSNRYKSDEAPAQPVQVEAVVEAPIQFLIQEEVTREYVISGITLSRDGPHTVWINSIAYEDGEQLEDESKIKVLAGDEIQVRITAPDGRNHYATSGQTLVVTYLAPVEN